MMSKFLPGACVISSGRNRIDYFDLHKSGLIKEVGEMKMSNKFMITADVDTLLCPGKARPLSPEGFVENRGDFIFTNRGLAVLSGIGYRLFSKGI